MSALATITVGALSRKSGVDVETNRSYERLGLIAKPRRAAGGLQLYRTEDAARLTFIRRARELGFDVDSIRELLGIDQKRSRTCREIYEVADRHLTDIRSRLADLMRMESALAPLVNACPRQGGAAACPILSTLSHPA